MVGLVVTAAAMSIAAPTAAAATAPSGPIVVAASNRCIEVPSDHPKDATVLQLFDCDGSARQQWTIAEDGSIRVLGKCMDTAGSATPGTVVDVRTCDGGASQTWRKYPDRSLRNPIAGLCLAPAYHAPYNGTLMTVATCTGKPDQWMITPT